MAKTNKFVNDPAGAESGLNDGLGDDLAMIDYLVQHGEIIFDCAQVIFNSDSLDDPHNVQYVFSAWDRRSYHQALLECVGRVEVLERKKATSHNV